MRQVCQQVQLRKVFRRPGGIGQDDLATMIYVFFFSVSVLVF